jgi:putative acetyltransferase
MTIREEQPHDVAAIREINLRAFDTSAEADIVDLLRQRCAERLSLVAQLGDQLVGHILFTPAMAQAGAQPIKGMALAPLAVLPLYQQQGIGSALVRCGVEMVRAAGYPFLIVLGHPRYYPRFGFERASAYGLKSEYSGVPEEAFMIMVFEPEIVKLAFGEVRYQPEFAATT